MPRLISAHRYLKRLWKLGRTANDLKRKRSFFYLHENRRFIDRRGALANRMVWERHAS